MVLAPIAGTKAYDEYCNECGHVTSQHLEFLKVDFKEKKIHISLVCIECKDKAWGSKRTIIQNLEL